jgi:creatinine amidohydrolase
MRIIEMSFDKVRDYLYQGGSGIVIPFGTVEPHGPHLPMGTDCLLAQSIGEKIAEKFGWLTAPTLNYGVNNSLAVYPGATTIDEKTYSDYITQLIEGYVKIGFTHIILSNGHGPNSGPLQRAARKLTIDYPDIRVFVIDWWVLDSPALIEVYPGKTPGHAGIDETAAVVYFHGNLVNKDKLDTKSWWTLTDGVKVYPAPASCLLMDDKSLPDFDDKKAARFMEMVLEIIYARIESAIEGFEYNLGD